MYELYIGNKNYSSWSLRPWILMRELQIPFEERLIPFDEEKNWVISIPDPIEAIKYRMEEMGLKQKDLVPLIGSKSKVSELLNYKINLSLSMISNLSSTLHIPLEVLISKSFSGNSAKRF